MPGPRAAKRQTVNGSWRKAAGPGMPGPYRSAKQKGADKQEAAGGGFDEA